MSNPDSDSGSTITPILKTDVPAITSGYRLQYEEAQESWVLLYPEGMVKLNPSAAEILKRCDGKRNLSQVTEQLEKDFNESDLEDDVLGFLTTAREQKWVHLQ